MISRLKDKLANDNTVSMAWIGLRDPQLISAIARQKFDSVLLDAQHAFHDEQSILDCIPGVITAGKSPLVRIPLDRWDMCQRVLDFGALGVVAPMINTVSDAKAFADAMKYPTTGARSYGPRHAATLYGLSSDAYITAANDCTFAFAQIETQTAFDNLDDILAVDGIDGVLMGPSDFSISVTGNLLPDPYGPGTIDMVADIARRARSAGKHAAAFTMNAEHANLVHSHGYRMISLAMDDSIVAKGSDLAFKDLDF